MTYVILTYPTTRSSFQLVVARGESFPRFIFQGFAMPSAKVVKKALVKKTVAKNRSSD